MKHTTAIDVWNGNSRVSHLWEDLLANCVPPDPVPRRNTPPAAEAGYSLHPDLLEMKPEPLAPWQGQSEFAEPGLLEKAGLGSLRLIKHALEALTAPPEKDPEPNTDWEQDLEKLPVSREDWTATAQDPLQTGFAAGLTFIKVSSEPDPQPGSAIDTRRMAYGLKIPRRPLHKRPIYQRLYFCLRHLINRGSEARPQ